MESSIAKFCKQLYTPAIQKLEFHLSHVIILGTHQCVQEYDEAFHTRWSYQDVNFTMVMYSDYYQSFIPKSNLNNLVEIDHYLWKTLCYITIMSNNIF